MRCPNCHSVVGNNHGLCQYCGYDIGEYVRTVQDYGIERKTEQKDERETVYAHGGETLTQPAYNFENAYFYYKREYEKEKNKNDRYKKNLLYGAIIAVLLLHLAELAALAAIYLT